MTETENVKALECCADENNCAECPLKGTRFNLDKSCAEELMKVAAELIKSKNEKINELQLMNDNLEQLMGIVRFKEGAGMSKVLCASIDCEYNHNKKCTAKEIKLNDGHIHTVHQGFKHIHECKTYKKSEYYKELEQTLQEFNNALKGGAE